MKACAILVIVVMTMVILVLLVTIVWDDRGGEEQVRKQWPELLPPS
jgi:hypothetical protein